MTTGNLSPAELVEQAIRRGEGQLSQDGPLVVITRPHTGRSPNDKYIVREASSAAEIWWAKNGALSEEQFERLCAVSHVAEDGQPRRPYMVHRALYGSVERFMALLIEHYAGNFPLWLSPEQVRIVTISDDPKLLDYARSILNELRAHQVRAEIDESSDKINGKIQRAEQMKVHTMFVIGKRDMEANAISVRVHGKGNLGAKSRAEAIEEIVTSIKERRT